MRISLSRAWSHATHRKRGRVVSNEVTTCCWIILRRSSGDYCNIAAVTMSQAGNEITCTAAVAAAARDRYVDRWAGALQSAWCSCHNTGAAFIPVSAGTWADIIIIPHLHCALEITFDHATLLQWQFYSPSVRLLHWLTKGSYVHPWLYPSCRSSPNLCPWEVTELRYWDLLLILR